MARRGASQVDVAEALGLTQPQVSRRLAGRVEFSASELSRLSARLGVPVSAFFGEPVRS
ncbi:helix-turn-helix domain-containing protein [Homoserinibacter sp. GY 40078]|uniref:helix-turn-helix domain-containing protein n=1 Tax=Homoserinibacter sp. GY 40078 TaxID=2603275 RepID=UPI00351A0CCF